MNYQVGGENPAGYHLVNLALHLAVAALVWEVLRRLIPGRAALIAAVIFAVHPFAAEPVNYVFARAILLAALFSLLAIRSWVMERPWAAVAWFRLAMLAKEECAALPAFLMLLDFSRGVRWRWPPLAAMFGIALGLGLRTVWATAITPGALAGAQAGISPLAYFAAQGLVVLKYLSKVVVPWGFFVDYRYLAAAGRTRCRCVGRSIGVGSSGKPSFPRAGFRILVSGRAGASGAELFHLSRIGSDRGPAHVPSSNRLQRVRRA